VRPFTNKQIELVKNFAGKGIRSRIGLVAGARSADSNLSSLALTDSDPFNPIPRGMIETMLVVIA
jgi:hypothetical protein